jgi:hypothetical protein
MFQTIYFIIRGFLRSLFGFLQFFVYKLKVKLCLSTEKAYGGVECNSTHS